MGFFLLIHQNLGANFGAPKSGHWSQKQPVLSPGCIIYQKDITDMLQGE